VSAESEGDVTAKLGTNCNLEKTMASVCPAWRCPHHELYLLSLCENVNSVCDVNENVSSSQNVNRKRKRTHDTSSKLWHCRLGYFSRGRIERLVMNKILPPLEFSDLEQCI
jgi:hypothetical protein